MKPQSMVAGEPSHEFGVLASETDYLHYAFSHDAVHELMLGDAHHTLSPVSTSVSSPFGGSESDDDEDDVDTPCPRLDYPKDVVAPMSPLVAGLPPMWGLDSHLAAVVHARKPAIELDLPPTVDEMLRPAHITLGASAGDVSGVFAEVGASCRGGTPRPRPLICCHLLLARSIDSLARPR